MVKEHMTADEIREYLSHALKATRIGEGLSLAEVAELIHCYFDEKEVESLIKQLRAFTHDK